MSEQSKIQAEISKRAAQLRAGSKPVPTEPLLARIRNFLRRQIAMVRLGEFALSATFAGGAWYAGAEMFIAIPGLIFAWIFALIGLISSQLSAKAVIVWGICLFLLFSVEEVILYQHYQKPDDLSTGGSVQLGPLAARLYPNGRFRYPVVIRDNGDEAILNYNYRFHQIRTSRVLSATEENQAFEEAMKPFFDDIQKAKGQRTVDIYNLLNKNDSAILAQPKTDYDQETVDKISKGEEFLYNFLSVRYTDKKSIKSNRYYIAEYCGRDGALGGFVPCVFHNFMKHQED